MDLLENEIKAFEKTHQPWRKDALCDGMDSKIFFPGPGVSQKEAMKICEPCPVRDDCLEFAIENGEHYGIWGGMNELDRQKIRVERGLLIRRTPADDTVEESTPLHDEGILKEIEVVGN